MIDIENVFYSIKKMIRPEYLKGSEIKLKENKNGDCSIIVSSQQTAYRAAKSNLLIAKSGNKIGYVYFPFKYAQLFQAANIDYSIEVPKEGKKVRFITIDSSLFEPNAEKSTKIQKIINQIFVDVFSFPAFGCCSSYNECSDTLHCIHPDLAYATACQYRKNLESGKIFYGKNKNI